MSRSNRERTEATRQALITAGRRLFVDRGYAETPTPDIVTAAGVTRGALYHHFEDKKALFRAVVEQEAAAVALAIEAGSADVTTPRQALLAGASAYFDAMAVEGRTRLLLLEAPAVLGPFDMAALDGDHAEASLRSGLLDVVKGSRSEALLGPLTALLSSAFDRAALAIAGGGDRAGYEAAIALLLDGLTDELRR
ncbi:TetR family transcriptional regulator [Metarhizobium album]|uniref:TetR family transcriptional regulator n=1 Tax=Metarhizobium album TaxID=2182425 RepID=A0A2U2DVV1_9HYPH|nr:TetR/AcrR family transcriptional regulator [Rhizobium album]PWE57444.1 TetR family transcriptional regulator [Rhizobium album]